MPIIDLSPGEVFLLLKNEHGLSSNDSNEWMKNGAYMGIVERHKKLNKDKGKIFSKKNSAVCVNIIESEDYANIYDSSGLFSSLVYNLRADRVYSGLEDVVSRLKEINHRTGSNSDDGFNDTIHVENYVARYVTSFAETRFAESESDGRKPQPTEEKEVPECLIKEFCDIPFDGRFLLLPDDFSKDSTFYMGELFRSSTKIRRSKTRFSEAKKEGTIGCHRGFLFKIVLGEDRAIISEVDSSRYSSDARVNLNLNKDRLYFDRKGIDLAVSWVADSRCRADTRNYVAQYLKEFSEKSIIAR